MAEYKLTLCKSDLIDYINGGEDVSDKEIERYVEKYRELMQKHLGSKFSVATSKHSIMDKVNGLPLRTASDDIQQEIADAAHFTGLEMF